MKPWWGYCLWPGLAPICLRGAWSGLALAVGFAVLLNLLLLSTLVYTELFPSLALTVGWACLGGFWALSAPASWWWLGRQTPEARISPTGDLYPQALSHYLLGQWFEAEQLLRRLLAHDDRDADARLMLASLLRHTGRRYDAVRELDRLSLLDEAAKWVYEIRRERELIEAAEAEAQEDATLDVSEDDESSSDELSSESLEAESLDEEPADADHLADELLDAPAALDDGAEADEPSYAGSSRSL